ncbi:MAG TPA: penicillin acylase family protein [Candidatus Binatia bacterium]|nr:penicillin acylase family protein [Candidatus Binatia bacterium]
MAVALLAGIAASTHAATVTITRDKWGVPHIFIPPSFGSKTAQLKALGFPQGYATAQDRMVQLEFFRRAVRPSSTDRRSSSARTAGR